MQELNLTMIYTAEEFLQLRTSEDPEKYNRAAHDEASDEVWLDVIARMPDMKKWVAHNKTVPLNILAILAEDKDPDIRWWVASKRKLNLELFEKLAADPQESVRGCIAANKKAPESILRRLSEDVSETVREFAKMQLDGRFS